jgi:hypothetical protein
MDDQIDFIYGIVDDILKAMKQQEDKQRIMSDAEVITQAIAERVNGKETPASGI